MAEEIKSNKSMKFENNQKKLSLIKIYHIILRKLVPKWQHSIVCAYKTKLK